jgi:hypothetical protein
MPLHPRVAKLGQVLVRAQVIDQTQLTSALAQAEQWGARLGKVVVEMRLAKESAVVDAIASATGVARAELSAPPEPLALQSLDPVLCQERGIFPLAVKDGGRTLHLAMCDPTDLETMDQVQSRTRMRVKPFLVGEVLLGKAIQKYYHQADVSLESEEEAPTIAELDELKLVDVTGRTLMVSNAKVSLKAAQAAAAVQSFGKSAPPPKAAPPASAPAGDLASLQSAVTAMQQQLVTMKQAQENGDRWLRAVIEVLIEKKVLSADELRGRLVKR